MYPLVPGTGHAHTHLCLLHEGENAQPFLLNHYARDERRPQVIGKDILDSLTHLVASADDHINTVILSSEAWFYRARFHKDKDFRAFMDNFNSVSIVCYVRRPSEYYVSVVQQRLKADHQIIQVKQPRFKNVLNALDYEDASIIVREYSRNSLLDRDIITDFFHNVLGSDAPDRISSKRENATFSAPAMQILREYRRSLPDEMQGHRNHDTIAFETALREIDSHLSVNSRPIALPKIANWLDRKSEDLDYLKENFGFDFSNNLVNPDEPNIRPDSELDSIIELDWSSVHKLRQAVRDAGYMLQ